MIGLILQDKTSDNVKYIVRKILGHSEREMNIVKWSYKEFMEQCPPKALK